MINPEIVLCYIIGRIIEVNKPEMSTDEIEKFIKYLDCCELSLVSNKSFVNCIKLLKADLTIYKRRNELKEVRSNGSKSKAR